MVKTITDKNEKRAIAKKILELLPEWFGIEESREEYIQESMETGFYCRSKG